MREPAWDAAASNVSPPQLQRIARALWRENQGLAIQIKRIALSDDSAGVVHHRKIADILIDYRHRVADHACSSEGARKNMPLMQKHFLLQAARLTAAIGEGFARAIDRGH